MPWLPRAFDLWLATTWTMLVLDALRTLSLAAVAGRGWSGYDGDPPR